MFFVNKCILSRYFSHVLCPHGHVPIVLVGAAYVVMLKHGIRLFLKWSILFQ